jgi:hypothetical protein
MFVVAAIACGLSGILGCSLLYSADAISNARRDEPSPDGAAGGDAGGEDAGGDAGGDTSVVSTCDSPHVFCDGFEHGLGAWNQDTANGGTVTVDTLHRFRGNSALHASLPAGATNIKAALTRTQSWGRPVYIRFFVYLTSPLYPADLGLLQVQEPAPSQAILFLYTNGFPNYVAFGSQSAPDASTSGPLVEVPLETWVCMEVALDGTNATLRMNGGDTPLATVTFVASTENVLLNLGLHVSQSSNPAFDAWFDEVAVDNHPIGCTQ